MNNVATAVIFCGGKGSRLGEVTRGMMPKPMVKIGNFPIIWHLINFYRNQGVRHVILCTGHLHDQFNHWFSNLRLNLASSLKIEGGIPCYDESTDIDDLVIDLIYTGEDTMTASRLAQVRDAIRGDTFFMTYGDGLSDVNLGELYQIHKKGGYSVTITGVSPLGRFGEIEYSGTQVNDFSEKPFDKSRRINGGFMCAEKSFIDQYIIKNDPNIMLEEQPLQQCAADGKLGMFLHNGFWQCMDNPRDYELLSRHAMQDNPPWNLKYD